MSRLAKKPIIIPDKVQVEQKGNVLIIKGTNGVLSHTVDANIIIKIEQKSLRVDRINDELFSKAIQGTTYVVISNHIKGVLEGFIKKLQLHGVGYKAKISGRILELNLGKSHPIKYEIPDNIKIETPSQTDIVIFGADKALVGQTAADIRRFREPEPYKGKGVRYLDEIIELKETKKAKK